MAEISRRSALTLLGAGALAAGAAAAANAELTGASAPEPAPGPDNPVRVENRLPGSADWRIGAGGTVSSDDLGRQIKGYASATSVNIGDSVDFHVSTDPARAFTVSVYRLGHYAGAGARRVAGSPWLPGRTQPAPVTDHPTGTISCRWGVSWTLNVPRTWTAGMYLAALTADSGHRSFVPFVVRDDARRADFLVILPFSTYQAYNQWPLDGKVGKSLYYGYGHDGNPNAAGSEAGSVRTDVHGAPIAYRTRARRVSFARPYSAVGLPQRADLDYEFLQWAERSGYDLSYATSVDLHDGRINTSQYSALIFSGHDEYWSRAMRDTVASAVESGTHAAFIAANNVYWHVRFEPDAQGRGSRLMTCWKSDPDPQADASGPTCLWRTIDPHGAHAEQSLIGVQYNGIPKAEMPLVVSGADHWFWAGTGVVDGETIPRIVGGEADGFDAGAPKPKAARHTMLSASHFMAQGGSNWPRIQHTSLYETPRGALVFGAATFNWSLGLNRPGYVDARIQRATANLFSRLRQRVA
ncbi:hypothetical protein KGA66_23550 [Actinocrinis puniceicyclus]|uniref:N,N-dimethylformamidase beta subunit-like C-terminal domain-containing protein n=1 Tax=Actinocrinis puniceicyclus TaxID=977794 RepID=A0A8J8BEX3_9ACTN|nr:N,N-dimethylformamidase beta subunit family domain-containing protein [Actinocrinis puniceicyclus]MBS2966040.1 hypothetical protein [Actinocrinis puniceicyclus]